MPFKIAILAVILGANVVGAGEKNSAAQKHDVEQLLKVALPFAVQMLTNHGEFYPFGATMDTNGKIANVGGYTGDEHPKSTELIDLLKGAFRREGETGKIMACALVYDIRTTPPGQTEKTDAVAVDLDHRDGLSVIMAYPYKIGPDKTVQMSPPFAIKGKVEIFKPRRPSTP
jgi:hypothetical protein